MATYIGLAKWTQQGVERVKDSPARLDAAKAAFRAVGAEIKAFYMTTGRYDMVIVVEAPDEAKLATALLTLAAKGSVRTETLRAFPEAEYRKVIAALP